MEIVVNHRATKNGDITVLPSKNFLFLKQMKIMDDEALVHFPQTFASMIHKPFESHPHHRWPFFDKLVLFILHLQLNNDPENGEVSSNFSSTFLYVYLKILVMTHKPPSRNTISPSIIWFPM